MRAALPVAPAGEVLVQRLVEGVLEAPARAVPGLGRARAEAEGEDERAAAGREVDLADQRHVAVLGPLVAPGETLVPRQVLPAVRDADEAGRAGGPRLAAGERQGGGVALRHQHRDALVVAAPGRVAVPLVAEVGGQERVEAIVAQLPLERREGDVLQDDVPARVGDHHLLDPVAALAAGVDEPVGRHALLELLDDAGRVALLLGEEVGAVGDDQPEVARAGHVDARVVDLVQDAVADREPDAALVAGRGPDAALGARRPARRAARPARRVGRPVVVHAVSPRPLSPRSAPRPGA